jgi:N-acetyl-gamma-glutamyl-phosphate reductase
LTRRRDGETANVWLVVEHDLTGTSMNFPVVFIDGDQGTTGLQIRDRLRDRTDIRILTLPVAERKDPQLRAEAINSCDIAILCLPDHAAREAVAAIRNSSVRVA